MTVKQEYRQFLDDNFKGTKLKPPVFYSFDFGLRFDLQVGEPNTDEYFNEVTRRSSSLFQSAFDSSDKLFFVFTDYRYKKRKINLANYMFTQIDNLNKKEITFTIEHGLGDPSEKFDFYNVAILKLSLDRINYKNMLTAIGHTDFPPRKPTLDENGCLTEKRVYFLNISRKLIFHMYDDRGLDIVASNKETLRPIYNKHNDWILDYDREEIDKLFR